MTDEQTGNTGAADQNETGIEEGAADQTGVENPAAEDKSAQVEAFKRKAEDEVHKRQQLESQLAIMQDQINLMQQGQPAVQAQSNQPDDDEYVQYGEIRREMSQTMNNMNASIQLQNFVSNNADFGDIVGTYNPNLKRLDSAEPLRELIKDNPHLYGLDNALITNPALAPIAYTLAKQYKLIKEGKATTDSQEAFLKSQEAAGKIQPLSTAAATGGGSGQDVGNMNTDELMAYRQRVQAGEFG